MRIVSLFPSGTEVVVDLGLADNLVGISHQCTWPLEVQHLPRVTDDMLDVQGSPREISLAIGRLQKEGLPVYVVNGQRLADLQPDVVLTQAVCDVCAVPERQTLATVSQVTPDARVLTMDVARLQDIMDNILAIGSALGAGHRAEQLVQAMEDRLAAIGNRVAGRRRPRVFIVEWTEPIICSGHWIPDLVEAAGGHSLLTKAGGPSRVVDWAEVVAAAPEILLVMPCGCSLDEAVRDAEALAGLPGWHQLPAVQSGQVFILDGSVCARHGPRTVDVAETFAHLFHPDLFGDKPAPTPVISWQAAYGEAS